MNEVAKAKTLLRLTEAKGEIEKQLEHIESDAYNRVNRLVLTGTRNREFNFSHTNWFHEKRFHNKIKYLLVAELKETLDEVQKEIDKLVTFKEDE